MIERAARALFTPYTAKDGIYSFFFKSYDAVLLAKDDDDGAALHLRHLDRAARAALSAALDPHDSELQNIILGAMGFFAAGGPKDYSAMARVQAHDAIAALKSASLPPAQSVNDQRRNGGKMMEATKHTPGPWEIVPYGDGSSLVIHSDDDNRVCFMATACADRPSSHATIRANAALIAAAPDLHETERKLCNEVAGIIETWEHALRGVMGNTNFNVLKLRYDEARAALLRASPTEEPALPPQAQAAQDSQPQE